MAPLTCTAASTQTPAPVAVEHLTLRERDSLCTHWQAGIETPTGGLHPDEAPHAGRDPLEERQRGAAGRAGSGAANSHALPGALAEIASTPVSALEDSGTAQFVPEL